LSPQAEKLFADIFLSAGSSEYRNDVPNNVIFSTHDGDARGEVVHERRIRPVSCGPRRVGPTAAERV
jgi:hypothetical protein